jgi:FeS assembly SUF system regulator
MDVLRITRLTDYGIMLLARMAELEPGAVLSAREAADWGGLSLPTASKILKALAREGIVVSHRGASGGYSLARPPSETSVASVIRALEGPISMVDCGIGPGHCEQETVCPVRVNWSRINRLVENVLDVVPISEMTANAPREPLALADTPPSERSCTAALTSHDRSR